RIALEVETVGIVAIAGSHAARRFPVQAERRADDIAVGGIEGGIEIKAGFAEGAIGSIADAARGVTAKARPIVNVMPTRGLDVHLAVSHRKCATSNRATTACPGCWRAVILRVAAKAAKTADVHRIAV